ncbi:DNA polymerase III subunit beta [Candidatus Saccharibacteria bacterium]|nr:DNA polymerase III subunit beta [Candidatus Saccharibacteria bacterium]
MKIQITQNKLSRALNIVSRVAAGSRATLPVLNNVLIRADDGKVSLTTTNLDMAIVDFLPVKPTENGVITVPARLLADFVGNLPRNEKVEIETKETKIIINAGKYKSVINGAVADEFPELPEIDEKNVVKFVMDVDEFKNGVQQVIIASSNDLTRPTLTGVYFNTFERKLFVAATDGYRLAEKQLVDGVKSEVAAIVPASSLQEVLRAISDEVSEVEVLFDESQVKFRLGEIEITSRLIDGSFPNYKQLIPNDNESILTLNKNEVLRITKMAALFAREVGGSIVCESNKEKNVFSIASVANEFGENDSEIETEVTEDAKVTINSRFLIDAINALSEEEMIFEFSKKLTPVVVKNKKNQKYTHIIMPLKS